MTFLRKELGSLGEELAAAYLQRHGYRILARNYRVRLGELDIIADDGGTLVFVEVRTRNNCEYGTPFDSITRQKQQQLSRVALEYVSRHDLHDRAARFDVVGILMGNGSGSAPTFEVVKNAFELCYSQ